MAETMASLQAFPSSLARGLARLLPTPSFSNAYLTG